jgi:hypothetical protein
MRQKGDTVAVLIWRSAASQTRQPIEAVVHLAIGEAPAGMQVHLCEFVGRRRAW